MGNGQSLEKALCQNLEPNELDQFFLEKRTEHEEVSPNIPGRKLEKVLQYLSLKHDDPTTFLVCQWQKEEHPNKYYIIYRWLHAVYFIVTFIYTFWATTSTAKYIIFWTNWGYLFCLVQSIWSLTLIMMCWSNQRQIKTYIVYRFLHIVALNEAHAITILYWAFVHKKSDGYTPNGLLSHGINLVVMLIDFALVANPIKLLHFVYPAGVGILYSIFNLCYYLAGGTGMKGEPYIYAVIDWRKPRSAFGIVMGSIVLVIVIHAIVWGLDKLKKRVHSNGSKESLV